MKFLGVHESYKNIYYLFTLIMFKYVIGFDLTTTNVLSNGIRFLFYT